MKIKNNLGLFSLTTSLLLVRDLRFDNVPFRAGLILLQSDCLAGILFPRKSLIASEIVLASQEKTLELPPSQPPSADFFKPVTNLIKDLNHQGVTITDPNDPMAVRYRVNSPCRGCAVYLGTGVANPRTQTNNNGMGINFGLGFTMPFSP
jgi:hypothetical protein